MKLSIKSEKSLFPLSPSNFHGTFKKKGTKLQIPFVEVVIEQKRRWV